MVGAQEGCTESRSHGVPDLRKKCEIFHVNVSVKVNVYLYCNWEGACNTVETAEESKVRRNVGRGTSPAVQWLRRRGHNSTPGQGTEILYAKRHSQKKGRRM